MENVTEILEEDDVPRIKCNDKLYFNTIQATVITTFCEFVDELADFNTEQRNNCKALFQSSFSNATTACIVYTKQSERSNEESESYLNEVLLPKFDRALVETTKKRKRYPEEIARNYAKRLIVDRKYLNDMTVESRREKVVEDEQPTLDIDNKILNSYSSTVESLTRIKRMMGPLMTKAEDINKVKNILNSKEGFFGAKIHNCSAKYKDEEIHTTQPVTTQKRKLRFFTFKDEIGNNFDLFETYKTQR